MVSTLACLDIKAVNERSCDRSLMSEPCGVLPYCPVIRAKALLFPETVKNYIAVEHKQQVEACAAIWPTIAPEECCRNRKKSGWRYSFAGGILSLAVHLSVVALAINFLPAMAELPSGSEVAVSLDVMDEAAFAAMQEGTKQVGVEPQIDLPEPVQPDLSGLIQKQTEVASLPESDTADFTKQKTVAEKEAITLPSKPEPVKKVVQQQVKKPDVKKPEKTKPKNTQMAKSSEGKTGEGTQARSTTRSVKGKGSHTSGMGGASATAGQRSAVLAHLKRYKKYPPSAYSMRLEGSVGITFSIGADGLVKEARVHASSGQGILDRDALAMLRKAQPFPVSSVGSGITITTQIGYEYPR
ncbi:energy transducer TonB [Microvirga sp. W0021]|uniref:Protein TonB n=1 Tax=Hohaiivirga grylli TaxID=3133970 RepID=A0ABV0BIM2_9HYPH